jgi:hypothetical protein
VHGLAALGLGLGLQGLVARLAAAFFGLGLADRERRGRGHFSHTMSIGAGMVARSRFGAGFLGMVTTGFLFEPQEKMVALHSSK